MLLKRKKSACIDYNKSLIELESQNAQIKYIKKDLYNLVFNNHLGSYNFCKVTQIFLFSPTISINYFTHIDFSEKHLREDFKFLTSAPISITNEYKLAICQYTLSLQEFVELYMNAYQTGEWNYNNKKVIIDNIFYSEKKFIPENDPSGAQYDIFVPIEEALYGSNFVGNYYIHELFSGKNRLMEILSSNTIDKIQQIIKKCHLNFNLSKLEDRIGNIICKFNIESLKAKPLALNARGIKFEFSISKKIKNHKFSSLIIQEHDNLIYKNIVNPHFDGSPISVPINQAKTSISIVDITTGLTLFYGVFDYTVYSNYHSQITPDHFCVQAPKKRTLYLDDGQEVISLASIEPASAVYSFSELEMAAERRQKNNDKSFFDHGYIRVYYCQEHQQALHDIIKIINSNILWDLKEIWVIDPYLCADDLINTVFKCEKENIEIKAICAYSSIHGNNDTRRQMDATDFEDFKTKQKARIDKALGKNSDIKLEYRTVRGTYGSSFHDRYIMLKYNYNRGRVWSLGASLNSIGTIHSIVQIVEAPNQLFDLFNDLWTKTNQQDCLIFKN